MDRLLARLERRIGRFAIERLTLYIVGGMAAVFVLVMARPEIFDRLVLDMDAVKRGEVWRLVTYLFIPPTSSYIWILFMLSLTYFIGSSLESEWGAFKFNVFYFIGVLGTTIAAIVVGGAHGNYYLNLSMFLAFATLFPDYEIRLYFVIPVKAKWLALLDGAFLVYELAMGSWGTRAAIIAAVANYVLFFGGTLLSYLKGKNMQATQAARRAAMRSSAPPPPKGGRACAICGARQDDGADIRVCSCEKCGGQPRNLCLEHARNH
jgi:membrane associated rhomboid family serine protease